MKKVISIIILIIGSFLLFSCFLNLSESKYIGDTDDYLIQVVDKAPRIYNFTGGEQTYTAPLSGYYYVSAWGGNGGYGGKGERANLVQSPGGVSQEISGVYYLEKGETIYIYVGGAGESAPEGSGTGPGFAGGINGLNAGNNSGNGGKGGAGIKNYGSNNYAGAGAGGGAASFVLKQSQTLNSIVLASGGGGGGGGGFGSITGTLSNGGEGGNGAIQPGSHSTSTNGSDGSRASNSGGVGGTTNSSNGNGLAGGDGGIPALVRIGAGGGAGGGGRRI